jgi:hypothetical protein
MPIRIQNRVVPWAVKVVLYVELEEVGCCVFQAGEMLAGC